MIANMNFLVYILPSIHIFQNDFTSGLFFLAINTSVNPILISAISVTLTKS